MKKIIFGAGLAALFATQAFAQSYNPGYGTGNSIPTPPAWANVGADSNAFAYAPRSLRSPAAVYVDGQYVGTDPDANIRLQLERDPPGRD